MTQKSLIAGFILLAAALAAPSAAHADCFDFSARVAKPLVAPTPLTAASLKEFGDMEEASGAKAGGQVWASVEGVVDHSTFDLLQDLLTHRATRSGAAKKMDVKTLADAKNDLRQTAEFTIKPFPLVTVRWLENWTYNILKGSLQQPVDVVVAYEKTEGTSHIQHLCGTLALHSLGGNRTRVTLYEEVKATRRSQQDTLNGVAGTLRELRDLRVASEAPTADGGVKSGTTTQPTDE